MGSFYVYIITNKNHTVYYTGRTNNLARRVEEHKSKVIKGFTSRYNCNELLYFEEFIDLKEAIHREKQIKRYPRLWKENLINSLNPKWVDLSDEFELE
jgi:putative endonuclease